jgi:hypothetical protein
MEIHFSCPNCNSKYKVPKDKSGKKFTCAKCQQRLQIPVPVQSRTMLGEVHPPVRLPEPVYDSTTRNADIGGQPASVDSVPVQLLPEKRSYRSCLVVMLICAGLIALALFLLIRSDILPVSSLFSEDKDEALLRWIPDRVEGLFGIEWQTINERYDLEEIGKPRFAGVRGLDPARIVRIYIAYDGRDLKAESPLVLIRIQGKFDPNLMTRKQEAKRLDDQNQPYLELLNNASFRYLFNPTGDVLILSNDRSLLADSIRMQGSKRRLDEELSGAIQKTSGPIWSAIVGPLAQKDSRGILQFTGVPSGFQDSPHPLRYSIELSTSLEREGIEFRQVFRYSSHEKASIASRQIETDIRSALRAINLLPKQNNSESHVLGVILDNFQSRVSGSEIRIQCRLPFKEIRRLFR